MKTDKSRKVGTSKRSKGPAAKKSSVAKSVRGAPALVSGARKTLTNGGKPSRGRPAKSKPTN